MAELELAAGMMAAPNIRLVRKLRDGGMGSVWVAEHQALKTFVAVKFMHLDVGKKKDAGSRFSREASAAAQIKSPHVVQVFDHGVNADGFAFIVMELCDGEDLGSRLASRNQLPLADVATIVSQAAKALGKAHASGIVHRDIKPDNIFLTDVDGDIFVKVLDFGIAKQEEDVSMTMTSTGVMMGTPNYMAPEQMTNAKDAVPASDLWSLAICAYQALTGVLPFNGETVAGIAIAIERGKFKAPSELVPGLPKTVDAWFERAFRREPKDRFASAREMADELMIIVNPNARRPMGSELGSTMGPTMALTGASSQPGLAGAPGSGPVSPRSAPGRPPTQMGATLDGTVPMRKRGVALWIGAGAVLLGLAAGGYVLTRDSSKSGASTPQPTKVEAAAAQASTTAATATAASTTAAAASQPDASASVVANATASAPSTASGLPQPPSTGGPTLGNPQRPLGKPSGKWPPKSNVPVVKDRGF